MVRAYEEAVTRAIAAKSGECGYALTVSWNVSPTRESPAKYCIKLEIRDGSCQQLLHTIEVTDGRSITIIRECKKAGTLAQEIRTFSPPQGRINGTLVPSDNAVNNALESVESKFKVLVEEKLISNYEMQPIKDNNNDNVVGWKVEFSKPGVEKKGFIRISIGEVNEPGLGTRIMRAVMHHGSGS